MHKKQTIYALVVVICILITAQSILLGENHFWGGVHTHYNNYLIFKNSFLHLFQNTNLYDFYPEEYGDLYKYSPSFAVFMAPFYMLPDFAGLFLWNVLNCLLLFYSVMVIRKIPSGKILYFFLFITCELIVSAQNAQSNALVAALMLFSFNSFETERPGTAALFIVLGAYIKLFTLAGCLLFFFYPGKIKFVLYFILWGVVVGLLPLLFISPTELYQQYLNWQLMLANDHSISEGYSAYQVLSAIIGHPVHKPLVLAAGVFILLLPLIKLKRYAEETFRLFYCCMLLIWIVVFNHKAESPSYIIAMVGCGLWAFSTDFSKTKLVIVILCWLFVSALKTDLFPPKLRDAWHTDSLMAIMPAIILLIILASMMRSPKEITSSRSISG